MDYENTVPISALNQYDYSPRRCWWIHVAGEFADNRYTVEGGLLHERVHQSIRTKRGEFLQLRRVYVYSNRYGLSGFADVVEERAGKVYPVEYKRGRRGDWKNDQLQLCAQALCLEEMLHCKIERGFIYYAASQRRQEVVFDEKLQEYTVETIAQVHTLLADPLEREPEALYTRRCRGCSLYPICLPREVQTLKTYCGPEEEEVP
jgi:CRISPR-associated exonuclease Cas4